MSAQPQPAQTLIDLTCGRRARARRVAFVIDAEAYFDVLAAALPQARRSIWVLGWDIHSRVVLDRETPDAPVLATLLDNLARERPELDIHVLVWDHAMIYALERELLPIFSLGFRTHPRVHFHQDSAHPVGASHHQKLVVIDDDLAFCGGLDLTVRRWDTPAHDPDDDDRVDPHGKPYAPFHDAQIAVQGPAAAALGDIARERWRVATGETVEPSAPQEVSWPEHLAVDVTDVEVGIAQTLPAYDGRDALREIEALHLEAIASAQRHIYIENQYLTAHRVGDALAERLRAPDGPEVVIVGPEHASGWLEESTMGALRARLVEQLRAADEHDRLRLWYPQVAGQAVYVHSKIAIVDDRLVTVGSANLSNRSMGLDSEWNLVLESTGADDEVATAARRLRLRLLGEHLDAEPSAVEAAEREHHSLVAALDALRGGGRTLEPIEASTPTELQRTLLEEIDVVDPEGPIRPDAFVDEIIPEASRSRSLRRYLRIGALVLLIAGFAAAWRFTSLSELATPEQLGAWLAPLQTDWWAPLVSWSAFVLGGLVFFPITVLILFASVAHGPWTGFAVALAGVVANAALTYELGAALGRERVRRLAGARLNAISQRLAKRGVLAVLAVRIVPVAPFTVINLVAGASHVRFRDYLVGTLLGMLPGIVAMTLLGDRLWSFVQEPTAETLVVLGVVLGAIITGLTLLSRRLARTHVS